MQWDVVDVIFCNSLFFGGSSRWRSRLRCFYVRANKIESLKKKSLSFLYIFIMYQVYKKKHAIILDCLGPYTVKNNIFLYQFLQ